MERALQCNRDGEIAKTPVYRGCRRANRRAVLDACVWGLVVCSLGSVDAHALAQEYAEPIHLLYRAPPGCPDETAFVTRVRARTARMRLAGASEAVRSFTVEVESGRSALGRVVVEDRDHSQSTRQVRADTCSDVVDALALMVALAVDPTSVAPTAATSSEAPPAVSSSTESRLSTASPRLGGAVFGGADFAVATDVTPRTLLAGSPYVGWRSATAERLFAPSLRAAFIRAGSGMLGVPGGTAEFTWTVGRLDGCPIAWPRGALRVTECVRVEAGTLEAGAGMGVPAPRTALRAWLSAGALARAEWSFLPPIFIDAEAGAVLRVMQDRFYFNPAMTTAFQVPPLGVTAGVGVGALFF
jgi:hypothetical protein